LKCLNVAVKLKKEKINLGTGRNGMINLGTGRNGIKIEGGMKNPLWKEIGHRVQLTREKLKLLQKDMAKELENDQEAVRQFGFLFSERILTGEFPRPHLFGMFSGSLLVE